MLYWISFSDDESFLGVVIAEGDTPQTALEATKDRKLFPGGQSMIIDIPTVALRHQAWPYRNRLLQNDEIERIFGEKAEPSEIQKAAGDHCTLID